MNGEGTQPYIYMCPFSVGIGSDITLCGCYLEAWASNLIVFNSQLTSCVTSGKLLNLSEPQTIIVITAETINRLSDAQNQWIGMKVGDGTP